MRARLQFSIATAVTPEILIIDEALATGDADFKERSDARIREVIASAGTVFLATHVMSSVTDVCDRVLWLDHGELIADGDPEPITEAYREHNERIKQARARYGQG
jgi:teichoic acid transport system ATP-binding protein